MQFLTCEAFFPIFIILIVSFLIFHLRQHGKEERSRKFLGSAPSRLLFQLDILPGFFFLSNSADDCHSPKVFTEQCPRMVRTNGSLRTLFCSHFPFFRSLSCKRVPFSNLSNSIYHHYL